MGKRRGSLPSSSSTSLMDVEESLPVTPPPVPPGLRFVPSDQELIISFLQKKIYNQHVPDNRNIVNQVNLHKYHPADLVEKYKLSGEEAWYFFTPRFRKYFKGYRPNRTAGTGFWKASTTRTDIHVGHQKIGYKVGLVYYEGKQSEGKKTKWLMTEYGIHESLQSPNPAMQLDTWVLCKVYQNNGNTNSNVDEPDPEDAPEMSPSSPAYEAIQEPVEEEDELHHKNPINRRVKQQDTNSDQTRTDQVMSQPTSTVPLHIPYSRLHGLDTPFPIDEATKKTMETDVLLRNIVLGRRRSRQEANHLNQTDSSQPPKQVFSQIAPTPARTTYASQYIANFGYSSPSDTLPRLPTPSPSQIFYDHSHLPDNEETRNQEFMSHNNTYVAALPSSVPQSSNLQLADNTAYNSSPSDTLPRLPTPSPSQIFYDHSHLPDNEETRNQEFMSHNNTYVAALPSSVPQSSNLQLADNNTAYNSSPSDTLPRLPTPSPSQIFYDHSHLPDNEETRNQEFMSHNNTYVAALPSSVPQSSNLQLADNNTAYNSSPSDTLPRLPTPSPSQIFYDHSHLPDNEETRNQEFMSHNNTYVAALPSSVPQSSNLQLADNNVAYNSSPSDTLPRLPTPSPSQIFYDHSHLPDNEETRNQEFMSHNNTYVAALPSSVPQSSNLQLADNNTAYNSSPSDTLPRLPTPSPSQIFYDHSHLPDNEETRNQEFMSHNNTYVAALPSSVPQSSNLQLADNNTAYNSSPSDTFPRLPTPSPSQIFYDHSHLPDNEETRNQEFMSHNNTSAAALPSIVPQSSNLQLADNNTGSHCWNPLLQNSPWDNQISSMHNIPHPTGYCDPHLMVEDYSQFPLEIQPLQVAPPP